MTSSSLGSLIVSAVIALAAIAAATVAVSLGQIDGQTFTTLVAVFGGAGTGAGIHAAGVHS
jgi:hypothetical protein